MAFSKVITFTLNITFGLSLLVICVLSTEYNRILIFKEPVSNKALTGHVIITEKVPNEGSCRVKCYMEPNCVSLNVGPSDEGTLTCELNNATDESTSHSGLVDRPHYTYYGVENFCLGNPCSREFALCQVGFTEKGFRCKIHEGDKVEQCNEGFIPGEGSLSGSCYKLVTTPAETWNNAEAKCRNIGAHLVKIESALENEFLTRNFFGGSSGTYWIGLSDQVNEGKWIWTDGRLLEDYTHWGRDNPNDLSGNQDCGQIVKGTFHLGSSYFSGYKDGEWNDFRCDYSLGYICEQHLGDWN